MNPSSKHVQLPDELEHNIDSGRKYKCKIDKDVKEINGLRRDSVIATKQLQFQEKEGWGERKREA